MFLSFGILSLIFSILLCVHVVRTHREIYWILIILLFQPLGGLVYLIAIVLPEMFRGRTARRVGAAARETLDPHRGYREAKAAHEMSPTVANAIRLGHAAAAMGRHDEAEGLFRDAAQGVHADDPVLILGRANALIELGRPAEALELLGREDPSDRTPQAALSLARACEALGRYAEADKAYDFAAGRMPGLEGLGRYAAFLARVGRRQEAKTTLDEIDRRIARADPMFRKEGRVWRDLAAGAIGGA